MNLSIPDAASVLGVSETRLRKTLATDRFPTVLETRRTTTGLRQATMLTPEALELLHAHFHAPLPQNPMPEQETPEEETLLPEEDTAEVVASGCPQPLPLLPLQEPASAAQSVPLPQFNALLFQHNVLREELTRVTAYLDDCDRLLGEMVKTLAALEERTRGLEQARVRPGNPLTGALRSVSTGLHNALLARPSASAVLGAPEVYYANVLSGR